MKMILEGTVWFGYKGEYKTPAYLIKDNTEKYLESTYVDDLLKPFADKKVRIIVEIIR